MCWDVVPSNAEFSKNSNYPIIFWNRKKGFIREILAILRLKIACKKYKIKTLQ